MTESQLDPEILRGVIARELTGARQRTALLTDSVDEADLVRQHSPLMSPLVWDLAHIANQEELWLLREVGGRESLHPEIDPLYDAFEHPRSERPTLPLLPPAQARAYGHEVRGRVLDLLERTRFSGTRLLGDGFAFGMIAQHEVQHDETMLITHQIRAGAPVLAAVAPGPAPADTLRLPSEVLVPGGPFTMGTSTEPWALDNERPAHAVDVAPFFLDTTPVTCGAYADFIADGGYDDPRWWTAAGWEHRQRAGLSAPLYWSRDGGQWVRRIFGQVEPVRPEEPVLHVCWYEADAYARWAGRRLPTEAEWEKAARFDPVTGLSRRYPWGNAEPEAAHANLGQQFLRPAPASYPAGAAPCGARQLIGDVWEWTSSDFGPYPGFTAWPYREYSEVFFGPEYKVLRGGSFAVSSVACRGTFRNWDYPIRRQIFSGFRTARSALLSPGGPIPPDPLGTRLMCRHLAYLGPPATLRSVIIDPPHGLYRQAWAPRRQGPGTVNADGFGIGWYAPGDPDPVRYRRADAHLGGRILHRRSRGDPGERDPRGRPERDGGNQPRPGGRRAVQAWPWLFSHNGAVERLAFVDRGTGRHAAGRRTARAGGSGRLGAAVGAGPAPARTAASRRAGPWPIPSRRCGPRARPAGSTSCSPTASWSPPAPPVTPCGTGAPGRRWSSPPNPATTSPAGPRSPATPS